MWIDFSWMPWYCRNYPLSNDRFENTQTINHWDWDNDEGPPEQWAVTYCRREGCNVPSMGDAGMEHEDRTLCLMGFRMCSAEGCTVHKEPRELRWRECRDCVYNPYWVQVEEEEEDSQDVMERLMDGITSRFGNSVANDDITEP